MSDIGSVENPGLSPLRTDTQPWYRYRFVWLIIGILAWSVVTGLTLLVVAVLNADDVVSDTWYRDGRGVNRDIAADNMAIALGVRVVAEGSTLQLSSDVALPMPQALELALRHPTIAARDQLLGFVHQGDGFYISDTALPAGRWAVTLTPSEGNWRFHRQQVLGAEPVLILGPDA
ncbi:MAG: FixH family protein [Alcanivorax sp.]|nr:FixH family protein [Alcanivorax sp.]